MAESVVLLAKTSQQVSKSILTTYQKLSLILCIMRICRAKSIQVEFNLISKGTKNLIK